jgi:hypothetical protein
MNAINEKQKSVELQRRMRSLLKELVEMNTEEEFREFQKIPRLARECSVTEKLDGTNAQVHVLDDGTVLAGSKARYLTPEDDNFGFAAWVREHEEELRKLGPGRHYGEWWGHKINRGYGLAERRFSLFNRERWAGPLERPACCDIVPELWTGIFDTVEINRAMERLKETGSVAAPGFMKPEGIVVYHSASRHLYKRTLERDEEWKGKQK